MVGWLVGLLHCLSDFLADLVCEQVSESNLPVVIMGEAFKPETNLVVGSPSVLLKNILSERGVESEMYDPQVHPEADEPNMKAVYFIGTRHEVFKDFNFPEGSIVLDPHRYIPESDGITVIGIGG